MRRLSLVLGPVLVLCCVLSPSASLAGPPESDPPPQAPASSPDPTTTFQVQGPGTQSQQSPPASVAPGGGPNIQVNPQIQVQVQPTIDARAEPRADADADAKADARADAEPDADADADVSTETKTEHVVRATDSAGNPAEEPAAGTGAPAPGVPAQRRIRVVVRSSTTHHHDDVRAHRLRGRGLLTAGLVSFGAGYATAAINGGWLHDQCESANCRRVARELFVPVAGPFLAMQHVEHRDAQIKLGVIGGAQSLGVLLGLVGASVAIHDARERRRLDADGVRVAEHIHVAPHAGVDGAGLTLRARF